MYKQYSSEDAQKLSRLYDKYRYIMQREAYNILYDTGEAEDAVQQAFFKISKCLDRIQEDNPAMTCNFLKVVTRNVAKDIYKKKLYLNAEEDAAEFIDDSKVHITRGVSSMVISKDSTERIVKAILGLPDIYRDVLLLEKVYGYSRERTMKILNANYETVKKRLTRAKAKLLEVLREEGLDDGRENGRRDSK
ncbi:MAG: RNA polymerase sigma factor [Clostridia bacterium]|nr:RNA polymerase sigma factor [Clostridia bacterium]